MATAYTSDSIVVIRDDRDRVRRSPSLYIPNSAKEGAIHCIFEIVDNSIDELTVPDAVGNKLLVTYDKKTKEVTVQDNGRGIPHEKLLDALTVLAASGKFDNNNETAYKASGGAFGHGATVVLALSKTMTCTSTRDGKALTYDFVDGLKTAEKTEKVKGHGTYTKFVLDPKFIDTRELTDKDIRSRLKEKSYVFPDIKMEFTLLDAGKVVKTYNYSGHTIVDRVEEWKPSTPVIVAEGIKRPSVLKSIADNDLTEEEVEVKVAFAMSEEVLDDDPMNYMISYANTIKTYAGGTHTDGVKLGVQKFFKTNLIPKLKGKDKELPIMPTDMIAGLCMFVTVSLSAPEFRGQEKIQLSNDSAKYAVREVVYDALCEQKPSVVNSMLDFVKRVTRGRMASKKTRKKDVSGAFSKDRLVKFKDIVYNLDTVDCELLLCEGFGKG